MGEQVNQSQHFVVTVYEPQVDPGGYVLDIHVHACCKLSAETRAVVMANLIHPEVSFSVYKTEEVV